MVFSPFFRQSDLVYVLRKVCHAARKAKHPFHFPSAHPFRREARLKQVFVTVCLMEVYTSFRLIEPLNTVVPPTDATNASSHDMILCVPLFLIPVPSSFLLLRVSHVPRAICKLFHICMGLSICHLFKLTFFVRDWRGDRPRRARGGAFAKKALLFCLDFVRILRKIIPHPGLRALSGGWYTEPVKYERASSLNLSS